MAERAHTQILANTENQYATCEGFRKIPGSGSLDSCNPDIGWYRSGGLIYGFNPRIADLWSVNNQTLAISRRTRTHPSLPRCQRCSNLAENRHVQSWSPACIPNSMYRQRRINLDDLVSRMDPCARRE
jgi:hypothetical protein